MELRPRFIFIFLYFYYFVYVFVGANTESTPTVAKNYEDVNSIGNNTRRRLHTTCAHASNAAKTKLLYQMRTYNELITTLIQQSTHSMHLTSIIANVHHRRC